MVPDLGDFNDVEVVEMHVDSGDSLNIDDPILTLETEKAAMDIPSPSAGKVIEVYVQNGDKINQGDDLCLIELEESKKSEAKEKEITKADTEEEPKEIDTLENERGTSHRLKDPIRKRRVRRDHPLRNLQHLIRTSCALATTTQSLSHSHRLSVVRNKVQVET